ncbi:hypothetical protein HHK36_017845 [Tetracentron sinense]|uniref:Uncharacterized protein n=1 Tax=Tetracentron sinense TaxID=13715 RepID=A0A834Z2S5_TETSI|nr:hypothetical protein HHK36_017845 [Tetracentron sinense]
MEAKIGKFFDSVGSFFRGGDQIPWCDRDIIAANSLDKVRLDQSLEGLKEVVREEVGGNPVIFALEGVETSSASKSASGSSIEREGCEREVANDNGVSDELRNESIMRLSWALVHSRQPEDVQRGIAMLEALHFLLAFSLHGFIGLQYCLELNNSPLAALLANSSSPLQLREKLYLLAVGHYRSGDYSTSRQLVEQCLEVRSLIPALMW